MAQWSSILIILNHSNFALFTLSVHPIGVSTYLSTPIKLITEVPAWGGMGVGERLENMRTLKQNVLAFRQKKKKKSFFLFCTQVTGLCVMQLGCCKMWLLPWGNDELGLRAKTISCCICLLSSFVTIHSKISLPAHPPPPPLSLYHFCEFECIVICPFDTAGYVFFKQIMKFGLLGWFEHFIDISEIKCKAKIKLQKKMT